MVLRKRNSRRKSKLLHLSHSFSALFLFLIGLGAELTSGNDRNFGSFQPVNNANPFIGDNPNFAKRIAGLKTLHRFTLKAYLLPFLLTFFIALFVLFMQFLWKWVDELVGKGLDWIVVCQLFFYASLSLVPLALPLAILLSSLMSFGNLAEHYELAALKASGLSLQRIMSPLIVFTVFISLTAFYFSNNVLPWVNLKMSRMMFDITNQKPALHIKEGVFYNGIDDYSIYVGKKGADEKSIMKVLIYDHTPDGNNRVIAAESGTMESTVDKKSLLLNLVNGCSYEEMAKEKDPGMRSLPFLRNKFKEQLVRFDLSGFKPTKTNENLFKEQHQMLNVKQLISFMDTFRVTDKKLRAEFHKTLEDVYFRNAENYLNQKKKKLAGSDSDFIQKLSKQDRHMIIESAIGMVHSAKGSVDARLSEIGNNSTTAVQFEIELHKKFALSFSCLVMFFIGAPLGAIIRKGGLGMPVVVSLLFFVVYWVISISFEKMAKEGVVNPILGVWMAPLLLFPLGVFFTYKATNDSALFDVEVYLRPFKRLFRAPLPKEIPGT
jgi:lipopolysaccharide export system permease protein